MTDDDGWFTVHRGQDGVVSFTESRHAEQTVCHLVLGEDCAVLVDTGCGLVPMRPLVERETALPVLVVNTHSHVDHVAGNREWDEIAALDHEVSRRISDSGVPPAEARAFAQPSLVSGPLPEGVALEAFEVPPYQVTRWLDHGETIDLGGRTLEVLHTPGEAPDHLCLLDAGERLLFTGDLYFDGALWAHEPDNDIDAYVASLSRLATRGGFDTLLPGHNQTRLPASRLEAARTAFQDVRAGVTAGVPARDSLGRPVTQHDFGDFSITTATASTL